MWNTSSSPIWPVNTTGIELAWFGTGHWLATHHSPVIINQSQIGFEVLRKVEIEPILRARPGVPPVRSCIRVVREKNILCGKVGNKMGKTAQTRGKARQQEEPKCLSSKDEVILGYAHNPKVEGSNPSPATNLNQSLTIKHRTREKAQRDLPSTPVNNSVTSCSDPQVQGARGTSYYSVIHRQNQKRSGEVSTLMGGRSDGSILPPTLLGALAPAVQGRVLLFLIRNGVRRDSTGAGCE